MEKNDKVEENSLEISNKLKNKKFHIIAFIIAFFSAFALNIQFDKDSNWLGFIAKDTFSFFILMFIVGIYFLVNYSLKIKNKRLTICSLVLGGIFALTYFIGYLGETYLNTTIPTSKKFLLYTVLKIMCYFFIFSTMFYTMRLPPALSAVCPAFQAPFS